MCPERLGPDLDAAGRGGVGVSAGHWEFVLEGDTGTLATFSFLSFASHP